ncbi:MAG: TolB family protein, partial [Bryobacteraceae bacterium]
MADAPPAFKVVRIPRWLPWAALAALLLIALIALVTLVRRTKSPRRPVVRYTLPLEEDGDFALSPDGAILAYTASEMLWVRRLDALQGRTLEGTEGAAGPFWSPDSSAIGFFSRGTLKRVAAAGGPPLTLCEAPGGRGGTWSPGGSILFSRGVVFRVAAAGGTPQAVTQRDPSKQETAHRWPSALPDGRHFLYSAVSVRPEHSSIRLGAVDSKESRVLAPGTSSSAVFAEGFVLFAREGILLAQPFHPRRLDLDGDARPLRFTERVDAMSASATGVLAYRTGDSRKSQLAWFDRTGRNLGIAGEPGESERFAISPDGKRAVVAPGLWMLDFVRGTNMRLTFDPVAAAAPVWSPDGLRIAFGASDPDSGLYSAPSRGAGRAELLYRSGEHIAPDSWSPDGRFIVYTARDAKGVKSLWALPLADRKPHV